VLPVLDEVSQVDPLNGHESEADGDLRTCDPRGSRRRTPVDRLWARPVDVGRALAGRIYRLPLDLVLDVRDDFWPWNTGRHRPRAEGDTASCEPTTAPAVLRRRVEEPRPGALARASAAFRGDREPWHPGGWAFPLF
jgi:hypothetical protein